MNVHNSVADATLNADSDAEKLKISLKTVQRLLAGIT